MRKKWKRILCRLTGGHKYADKNLTSLRMPDYDATYFVKRCVKCGELYIHVVKDSVLFAKDRHAMPEVKFDD